MSRKDVYWDPQENPSFWDPDAGALPRGDRVRADERTRRQMKVNDAYRINESNPLRSLLSRGKRVRELAPNADPIDTQPEVTSAQWDDEEDAD